VNALRRQHPDEARDRPRRKRLDAAARRETILDAAIPMFATAGYEQTRMSDVATRVGVTEPVIFQNFGSKAELFVAALERAANDATRYLSAFAAEHPDVHDWLSHLLAAEHLDHLHTAPMFGVFLADAHRLQYEAGIGGALHRCVTRIAEAITAILQRGQAERSIRDDTSPDTLAWLVVSLIQARQFRKTHTVEQSPVLEHDLLASILDAVRPRDPDLSSCLVERRARSTDPSSMAMSVSAPSDDVSPRERAV
jgi:AcrR family transcriptional regulator